jgi:hypothetical protein
VDRKSQKITNIIVDPYAFITMYDISNPNLKTWPQEEMMNGRPSYKEKISISFISTWKKIDNSHCYDEPKYV